MKKDICRLDIGKLTDIVEPNPMKNLYLSPYRNFRSFIEGETAFLYNGFMISLYRKGEVSLKINGHQYRIHAGNLLLLLPEQFVEIESRSQELERVSIHVHPEILMGFTTSVGTDILKWSLEKPVIDISEEESERLFKYYNFMEKRYEEKENLYRTEIITSLYHAFLLEISNLYKVYMPSEKHLTEPADEKISRNFFALLVRHYIQERNVAYYAGQMCLTPRYLSKTIKRLTGYPALEWINKLIIVEIKKRLRTTDQPIWQISVDLNFSSSSAMVHFFKIHTGTTPLAYRNKTK